MVLWIFLFVLFQYGTLYLFVFGIVRKKLILSLPFAVLHYSGIFAFGWYGIKLYSHLAGTVLFLYSSFLFGTLLLSLLYYSLSYRKP